MIANAQEILQTALQLPDNERADLAASLIESLDQTFDTDAQDAWAQEVSRRVAEIDSGAVATVSWNNARRIIAGRGE
jgi:putative addiction module component (TIGR02574 family)